MAMPNKAARKAAKRYRAQQMIQADIDRITDAGGAILVPYLRTRARRNKALNAVRRAEKAARA